MNIDLELFRGLDLGQIKTKLVLMNRAINEAYGSYEEFVAAIEDSENGLTPEELLACAKIREADANWSATNLYRRYAEVSGDRDEFYDYLLHRHFLEDLRTHFPERVTPKLLKEFGEYWFNGAQEGYVCDFGFSYEAFRDAGYKRGMAAARRAALERCDLGFVKKYGIPLTDREAARLARDMIDADMGGDTPDICQFLMENGFTRYYKKFLETASLSGGYATCRHYAKLLGIKPSIEFLEKRLYPSLESEGDKFDLCRELHRRNPHKWEKELKRQAMVRRSHYLQCGEPIRAQQMARLCDMPLTVGDLLEIHARYARDERQVMRAKAVQALDVAAKLVAKQVGGRKKVRKTKTAA